MASKRKRGQGSSWTVAPEEEEEEEEEEGGGGGGGGDEMLICYMFQCSVLHKGLRAKLVTPLSHCVHSSNIYFHYYYVNYVLWFLHVWLWAMLLTFQRYMLPNPAAE
jgi:hypothetical protein